MLTIDPNLTVKPLLPVKESDHPAIKRFWLRHHHRRSVPFSAAADEQCLQTELERYLPCVYKAPLFWVVNEYAPSISRLGELQQWLVLIYSDGERIQQLRVTADDCHLSLTDRGQSCLLLERGEPEPNLVAATFNPHGGW